MSEIIIISTSASIEEFLHVRTEEYLEAAETIESLREKILSLDEEIECRRMVLECVSANKPNWISETFTVPYRCFPHSKRLANKGVSEMLALKWLLENEEIPDEAMIVKHTGRYKLKDNRYSYHLIESTKSGDDAILKRDGHNQVFFGLVAMRCRIWKDFLSVCDFNYLESRMVNIELALASFLSSNQINAMEVSSLGLLANIANNIEKGIREKSDEW